MFLIFRKRVRACNNCADNHENKGSGEKGSPDDSTSDLNSPSDLRSFQSSDEDMFDSERRVIL